MRKPFIFLLPCLLLLCSTVFCQRWKFSRPIQPHKAGKRSITPLPTSSFHNRISKVVMQKSLEQLAHAPELSKLSAPQRTLLLAHKFVQETNTFPRLVIAQDGKILPPEKYTPAQQFETDLGKRIKHILDHKTAPQSIRSALMTLKQEVSPKYQTVRFLENLNDWITHHQSWPRAEIKSTRPLTEQEEFEQALARYAHRLCEGHMPSVPKDLIEQIRFIRAAYDTTYHPFDDENTQERLYQLLQQTYAWLREKHTWPRAYTPDSQTQAEQKLGRALEAALQQDANLYPIVLEIAYLKSHYQSIFHLASGTTEFTPQRTKEYYFTSIYPLPHDFQRQRVYPTPATFSAKMTSLPLVLLEDSSYAAALKLIAWIQEHHTWPHINSVTNNDSEIQLATTIQQMSTITPAPFKQLRSLWLQAKPDRQFATMTPPQQLLKELQLWLEDTHRWPETYIYVTMKKSKKQVAVAEEEYTPENIRETSLARRILAFATYADEFTQGAWKQTPSASGYLILADKLPYDNPDLESLRKLYHQYNR